MVKPLKDFAALLVDSPVRTLIVADLHVGFEEELRDAGFMVPVQSWKIVESLVNILRSYEPKKLVVLGDLKHKVPGASKIEWRYLPSMVDEIKNHIDELVLVPGNHDGGIDDIIGNSIAYASSNGFMLDDGRSKLGLFHGHAWPSKELLDSNTLIMAHMHPVVRLGTDIGLTVRRRVWLRLEGPSERLERKLGIRKGLRRRKNIKLLVMPSFNEFLSGLAVNAASEGRELIGPVVRSGAFELSSGEVYTLDGIHLGKVSVLRGMA